MSLLSKLPIHKLLEFFESRNSREKVMLIGLSIAAVFALDYLVLIQPVFTSLAQNSPVLQSAKTELGGYRDDKKSKELVHRRWTETKDDLLKKEGRFVSSGEVPALLEGLSLLAQKTQVKILSLKPSDSVSVGSGYSIIPIRISAVAGTHELGMFLANLESGNTFYSVKDVKINSNPSDERRHSIELALEVYGKNT